MNLLEELYYIWLNFRVWLSIKLGLAGYLLTNKYVLLYILFVILCMIYVYLK